MSVPVRMPGVPDALAVPELKRFPLRRHRIPMGCGVISLVLPDDHAWLRQGTWAAAVVRGQEPPYWIRVWPAAVALARRLHRAKDLAGLRVLDLGCGVGLPGIVAAGLGAQVCFVDREVDALAFARWNADQQPGRATAATVQQVDWSQQTVTGRFDLVLLSDVSYHRNHHAPVRRQLAAALAPHGAVLHVDPFRDLASEFLVSIGDGRAVEQCAVATHHEGRRHAVRVALVAAGEAALADWKARLSWPDGDSPSQRAARQEAPPRGGA